MKKRRSSTNSVLVWFGGTMIVGGVFGSPSMIYATDSIKSEVKAELRETPIIDSSSVNQETIVSDSEKTNDVVTIKDPALENLVRRQLNKTVGELLESDMEKLTYLKNYAGDSDAKVSDLSGLECAVNLESLILSGHEISDLSPLTNLSKLETLNLSNNQITDITSLSALTNLYDLDLSDNQIVGISNLNLIPRLEYLYLERNQITDISSLSSLSNLYELSLVGNQITDISSLELLANLEYLDLSQNQIENITPLFKLNQLNELNLSRNHIVNLSLPEEVLFNLSYFDFTGQSISFVLPSDTKTLENSFYNIWGNQMDLFYSGYSNLKLSDDLSTISFGPLSSGLEVEAFFGIRSVEIDDFEDFVPENVNCGLPWGRPRSGMFEDYFSDTYCVKATFRFEAPPTIEATNQEVFIGDEFDVLDWVKATDNHDDTVSVEVIKSTIDANKPGTYEVIYKAVNSFGFETTKTIQVVVKEQSIKDPSLPEEDTEEVVPPVKPETPEDEKPEDEITPPTEQLPEEEKPEQETPEEDIVPPTKPETPEEDLKDEDESLKDDSESSKEEDKKPSHRPTVEAGFSSTLGLLGAGLIGSGVVYFKRRKK